MIVNCETSEIVLRVCHEPVRIVRDPRGPRLRVTTDPVGDTRTQQADKDQTDINNIVGRYLRTGVAPSSRGEGVYADVTGIQGQDLPELVMSQREVAGKVGEYNAKRKAEADAEAEADRAAGKAARMAKGAASKEGAPEGEAKGEPTGGAGGPAS